MSNDSTNKGVLRTYNDVQEWISENLEANQIPKSQNSVKVSIDYLNSSDIDLSPREYQREKVASYQWKVDLIKTLLINKHFQIPSIHVRIFRNENGEPVSFEIPDGQQRLSAVLILSTMNFHYQMIFQKLMVNMKLKG